MEQGVSKINSFEGLQRRVAFVEAKRSEMSVERVNLGERGAMVMCDGVSHTQEVFVLKMETGGEPGDLWRLPYRPEECF